MRQGADDIYVIPPHESFDLSRLMAIAPHDRHHICEHISDFDLDAEIAILSEDIGKISTHSLPWDAGDFVTVFLAGVLGGLMDVFIGKPSSGHRTDSEPGSLFGKPVEPRITSDSFFGLGERLKTYDLPANPIDAHLPGAAPGDHRLYSYGHDLLRFFKGLDLILKGKGPVGISGTGGEISLTSSAWHTPDSYWAAVLIQALHLYKDFWSARSLPLPGSTIIANMNDDQMPEVIQELTNNRDVNLRVMVGQALAMTVIEIMVRIWVHIKYRSSHHSPEVIKAKRDKMLLLGQSVGFGFNLGKIVVTKNPFFLNVPQMLRITALAVVVAKEGANLRNRAVTKGQLAVLRSKYETLKTLVLLDESVYYTSQIDQFITLKRQKFEDLERQNDDMEKKGFAETRQKLNDLRELAKGESQ
jgi:hypothetical protein